MERTDHMLYVRAALGFLHGTRPQEMLPFHMAAQELGCLAAVPFKLSIVISYT